MQILVKLLNETIITLNVQPTDTIREIRNKLNSSLGYCNRQWLAVFEGETCRYFLGSSDDIPCVNDISDEDDISVPDYVYAAIQNALLDKKDEPSANCENVKSEDMDTTISAADDKTEKFLSHEGAMQTESSTSANFACGGIDKFENVTTSICQTSNSVIEIQVPIIDWADVIIPSQNMAPRSSPSSSDSDYHHLGEGIDDIPCVSDISDEDDISVPDYVYAAIQNALLDKKDEPSANCENVKSEDMDTTIPAADVKTEKFLSHDGAMQTESSTSANFACGGIDKFENVTTSICQTSNSVIEIQVPIIDSADVIIPSQNMAPRSSPSSSDSDYHHLGEQNMAPRSSPSSSDSDYHHLGEQNMAPRSSPSSSDSDYHHLGEQNMAPRSSPSSSDSDYHHLGEGTSKYICNVELDQWTLQSCNIKEQSMIYAIMVGGGVVLKAKVIPLNFNKKESYPFEIEGLQETDTVRKIKEEINKIMPSIPIDEQYLLFFGKEKVTDGQQLGEHKIKSEESKKLTDPLRNGVEWFQACVKLIYALKGDAIRDKKSGIVRLKEVAAKLKISIFSDNLLHTGTIDGQNSIEHAGRKFYNVQVQTGNGDDRVSHAAVCVQKDADFKDSAIQGALLWSLKKQVVVWLFSSADKTKRYKIYDPYDVNPNFDVFMKQIDTVNENKENDDKRKAQSKHKKHFFAFYLYE